jgi:hypothetical protein
MAFNPILPCEPCEVTVISLKPLKDVNLKDDFIPIVEPDKTGQAKGFVYGNGSQTFSLSPYIEKRNYPLECIRAGKEKEFTIQFTVRQGNTAAKRTGGNISVIAKGIRILSETTLKKKYGDVLSVKISVEEMEDGACIDFFANDDDAKDYHGVAHVHCGRVMVENSK